MPESRAWTPGQPARLSRACLAAIVVFVFGSPSQASVEGDGYRLDAVYTGELLHTVSGGLARGSAWLDNLDLTLELDLEAAAGFGQGTLFLYALYNNGTTFADRYAGDLQVTSNIDAPGALRLFEAWYEVGVGPVSVRSGLYDLNSEFDVNGTGGLFLNSSHGIGAEFGQTGENGPSIFPVSSLALRVAWQHEKIDARFAVLDGVPGHPEDPASNRVDLGGDDGLLLVAELEHALGQAGRAWAGHWRYTSHFHRIDGTGTASDNHGWYAGAERGFRLLGRDASAFLRLGIADAGINPLRDYAGAGIVIDAPFADRSADQLGLAVGSAGLGDASRAELATPAGSPAARETTWELTYRVQINEHLALQPDLQYVQNPATSQDLENAWIVGLRFELATGDE